jgi:hypothetical protein
MTEHTNNSIIKSIYENCIEYYAFDAINFSLSSFSTNFNDLLKNFLIANRIMQISNIPAQYTYSRATDYYQYLNSNSLYSYESTLSFNGTNVSFNSNTQGNKRLMRNSVDYIKINANQNFQLSFTKADQNANYDVVLIKIGTNNVEIVEPVHQNNNSIVSVNDYSQWSSFVVAVIRFDGTASNPTQESKQYTIGISQYTGLHNIENKISIYPNPTSDYIFVDIEGFDYNRIIIKDILGKKIVESAISKQSNKLDISYLQNGIYFISILDNEKQIKTEKLIIK